MAEPQELPRARMTGAEHAASLLAERSTPERAPLVPAVALSARALCTAQVAGGHLGQCDLRCCLYWDASPPPGQNESYLRAHSRLGSSICPSEELPTWLLHPRCPHTLQLHLSPSYDTVSPQGWPLYGCHTYWHLPSPGSPHLLAHWPLPPPVPPPVPPGYWPLSCHCRPAPDRHHLPRPPRHSGATHDPGGPSGPATHAPALPAPQVGPPAQVPALYCLYRLVHQALQCHALQWQR